MKLMLLGAPGSGKGTQAKWLAEYFDIPQISTGDMLREAIAKGNELGIKAKSYVDSGGLVPDDIIIKLIQARIKEKDAQNGYILDGFPRTIKQAEAMLQNSIELDHVIEIQLDAKIIVKRLTGRRTHMASGRIYHIVHSPPKIEGKDDITGEPLVQRSDDTEQVILERLQQYDQKTKPLIEFYQDLAKQHKLRYSKVDGSQTAEVISDQIQANLTQK